MPNPQEEDKGFLRNILDGVWGGMSQTFQRPPDPNRSVFEREAIRKAQERGDPLLTTVPPRQSLEGVLRFIRNLPTAPQRIADDPALTKKFLAYSAPFALAAVSGGYSVPASLGAMALTGGIIADLHPEAQRQLRATEAFGIQPAPLGMVNVGGQPYTPKDEFWSKLITQGPRQATGLIKRFGVKAGVDADDIANTALARVFEVVGDKKIHANLANADEAQQYLHGAYSNELEWALKRELKTVNPLQSVSEEVDSGEEAAEIGEKLFGHSPDTADAAFSDTATRSAELQERLGKKWTADDILTQFFRPRDQHILTQRAPSNNPPSLYQIAKEVGMTQGDPRGTLGKWQGSIEETLPTIPKAAGGTSPHRDFKPFTAAAPHPDVSQLKRVERQIDARRKDVLEQIEHSPIETPATNYKSIASGYRKDIAKAYPHREPISKAIQSIASSDEEARVMGNYFLRQQPPAEIQRNYGENYTPETLADMGRRLWETLAKKGRS